FSLFRDRSGRCREFHALSEDRSLPGGQCSKAAPPTNRSMCSLTSIQVPSQECAPDEPALLALPSRHRGAFLPRRVFFSALRLRYLSHPARPVPFEWPLIVRAGNIGAGTYPWIPWFRRQFSWSIPAIRCYAPTVLK